MNFPHGPLRLLACMAFLGCQPDFSTPWRLEVPLEAQPLTVTDPLTLVEVDSIQLLGLDFFAGTALVDSLGGLWTPVNDRCTLARFQLPGGNVTDSIGHCGEGPREFRDITTFDILPGGGFAIWDGTLQRLSILSGNGDLREIISQPLRDISGHDLGIVSLVAISGSQLVLTHMGPEGSSLPLVTFYDFANKTVTYEGFPAPKETWAGGVGNGSPTDFPYACAGRWGESERVVISQRWAHESVVLSDDGTPLWLVFDSTATRKRIPRKGAGTRSAQLAGNQLVRSPICLPDGVLLRTARYNLVHPSESRFDSGGRVQFWDSSGTMRMDLDIADTTGGMLFNQGFEWNGGLWFADKETLIPTIRKFSFQPSDSPAILRRLP